MRANGCGLRSVAPHSMCSACKSDENSNFPETFAAPSGRSADAPRISRRVDIFVALLIIWPLYE